MSENILVDGKPLHLLRVIDLRDELKKRGIKATGAKNHLQELLKSAILSAQDSGENTKPVDESKTDKDSQEENSNESSDQNSADEQKVASISINEETETIKLTIRSSPRKSELPIAEKADSETESSQSETDSNESPKVYNEEVAPTKNNSSDNDIDNNNDSTNDSTTNESSQNDLSKEVIEPVPDQIIRDVEPSNHINEKVESDSKEAQVLEVNSRPSKKEEAPVKASIEKPIEPETIEESKPKDEISKSIELDETVKQEPKISEQELDSKPTSVVNEVSLPSSKSEPKTESRSTRGKSLSQSKTETEKTSPKVEETPVTLQPDSDSKNKTSIRNRLLSSSKSINEDDVSKPVQKKRRWGSSLASESSVLKKGISSDKLKQLISESEAQQEIENVDSSVKVSNVVNVDESVPSSNELINNESETKDVDVPVNNNNTDGSASPKNVDNEIQDQTEEAKNVARPISPAKNPDSTVLFVTGLVRPYTLPQLKKLLSANGSIDEEKFWIDKIKSKCYVVYSTVEEARKTRDTLHNLKWPQSSPKNLSVEFATLEDIDRCLNPENYEDLPPKSKAQNHETKVVEKKDAVLEISKGKYDIILNEPIRDKNQTKNPNDKDDPNGRNIREWDRNKVNLANRKENEEANRKRAKLSPEPTPDKKEKTRERSRSPEVKRKRNDEKTLKEANKKSESPAKMLEDLFRKTKSTPYIYWLPLTDEQSVEKAKQRAVIEKEKQERIARNRRENSPPPNRPQAAAYHNLPRERPKFQDNRRRSPSPPRRKRSLSKSPRRFSRYSRSRSPDQRRFSPRRRR